MSALVLTWRRLGKAHALFGPDAKIGADALGTIAVGPANPYRFHDEPPRPRCRFTGFYGLGENYIRHEGGTVQAVRRRVEAEITRRSIGLFGVDDVRFEVQE